MRQRLPSTDEQKRLLKKKGINIGRAKTKWSVYRLYNFYITQKHTKSTPRYLAYATSKRFEQRLAETEHPERIKVRSGTGKFVSLRRRTLHSEKRSKEDIEAAFSNKIDVDLGNWYPTVRRTRDLIRLNYKKFFYEKGVKFDYIKATQDTIVPAVIRAYTKITPIIASIIEYTIKKRGSVYSTHQVSIQALGRTVHLVVYKGGRDQKTNPKVGRTTAFMALSIVHLPVNNPSVTDTEKQYYNISGRLTNLQDEMLRLFINFFKVVEGQSATDETAAILTDVKITIASEYSAKGLDLLRKRTTTGA